MKFFHFYKKLITRILCILFAFCFILSNAYKVFAAPEQNAINVASLIQGSPLLGGVNTDQISKDDHIALSLYLSSLLLPWQDDYATAFFNDGSEEGSKGKYYDNIIFRSEEEQELLLPYIRLMCDLQNIKEQNIDLNSIDSLQDNPGCYPIFYRDDAGEEHKATLGDLFPDGNNPYMRDEQGNEYYHSNSGANSTVNGRFCGPAYDLYIKKIIGEHDSEPKELKVFTTTLKDAIAGNLCAFLAQIDNDWSIEHPEYPLYFDAFANICVYWNDNTKQHNQIIIPNCYNPNVTGNYINTLCYMFSSNVNKSGRGVHIKGQKGPKYFNDETKIEITVERPGGWFGWGGGKYTLKSIPGINFINTWYNISESSGKPTVLYKKEGNSDYYTNMYFSDDSWSTEAQKSALNRGMFLNYLIMAKDLFKDAQGQSIKINKNLFSFNEEDFNKALLAIPALSKEEKETGIFNSVYSLLHEPIFLVNWIINGIKWINIKLYNISSDWENENTGQRIKTLGYTNINELPIIPVIVNWIETYSEYILFIIFIFCITLGVIKHDLLPCLGRGFLCALILLILPAIYNKMTNTYNGWISKVFATNQNYWLLDYNKKWERIGANKGTQYQQLSSEIGYESVSNLKYIQQKSPVIISNTSELVMNTIAESGFGYLFLGAILKQYREGNIISSTMDEMFKRLVLLNEIVNDIDGTNSQSNEQLVPDTNYYASHFAQKISYEGDASSATNNIFNTPVLGGDPYSYSLREQTANVANPQSEIDSNSTTTTTVTNLNSEIQTQVNNYINEDQSAKDTRKGASGGIIGHKVFYILNGSTNGLNYNNNFDLNQSSYSPNLAKSIYEKYFSKNSTNNSKITKFNYFDESKFTKDYGYFVLTENIIPYFYMVYLDTFFSSNKNAIGYQLQGKVTGGTITIDGQEVPARDSILMAGSQIIDYADLYTLFKEVIPYCYAVSCSGRNAFPDKALGVKDTIGEDYQIYSKNPKSWLFDCNWAVHIMEQYSKQMADANHFSPYSYSESDNELERLCQEFYYKLTPQIEELVNNVNDKNMTKYILIRQMAVLTGLQFNQTFSSVGLDLHPQYLDAGSVGIDTLWRSLYLANGYEMKDGLSVAENLEKGSIVNLLETFLLFISTFILNVVFATFKSILITLFILASYFAIILRIFTPSKDQGSSIFTTLVGIFIGFLKMITIFSLPILALLFFSWNQVTALNLHIPTTLQISIITLLAWGTFNLAKSSILQHFGLYFDGQRWHFDKEMALSLGGETSIGNIKGFLSNVSGGIGNKLSGFVNNKTQQITNIPNSVKTGALIAGTVGYEAMQRAVDERTRENPNKISSRLIRGVMGLNQAQKPRNKEN